MMGSKASTVIITITFSLSIYIREISCSTIIPKIIGKIHKNFETKSNGNCSSKMCELSLGLARGEFKTDHLKTKIHHFLFDECVRMYGENVCTHLDGIYYDTLDKIVLEGVLIPEKMCKAHPNVLYNWTIDIPKTPLHKIQQGPSERISKTTPAKTTYKILQISDIHLDENYEIGSEATCKYPLCCRNYSDSDPIVKNPASKFGEYMCDTNTYMFESLLDYVTSFQDIDYLITTGDIIPHDVWLQSRSRVQKSLNKTYAILKKYFKDIPIYPSVGNHDSFPSDYFPSHRANDHYNISWLYDELAEIWSSWLPSSTHQTIRNGGFYSVMVKSSLKLIQINSIFCYISNFWIYYDNVDPYDQLKWLIGELLDAESKNINVHIIMHVPWSSSECDATWRRNFDGIIERFSTTVKVLFAGHDHQDLFNVRFDMNTRTIPTHVTYISPSVVPYINYNPRFRVYEIDAQSHNVIDHQTYYYDIDEAKADGKIQWKLLYSAKSEYNLEDLSPQSWANLMQIFQSNHTLRNIYSNLVMGRKGNSTKVVPIFEWPSESNFMNKLVSVLCNG